MQQPDSSHPAVSTSGVASPAPRLEPSATDRTELPRGLSYMHEPDVLTQILLIECAAVGIRRVAINCLDPNISGCNGWPWAARGNAFAAERTPKPFDMPAIWTAVDQAGIGAGCGNTDQYQLAWSCAELMEPAIWSLQGDAWRRIDSPRAAA